MIDFQLTEDQKRIKTEIESFILEKIQPYEKDPRLSSHGPSEELRIELNQLARDAGYFAPHAPKEYGGMGYDHVTMAIAFEAAGLSPLGPIALHCAAPDEGNMNLLSKIATEAQKDRYLAPLVRGDIRSCFCMTEPNGAGADPTQIITTAKRDGDDFILNGRKWFITGAEGADFTIIFATIEEREEADIAYGPTMFLSPMNEKGISLIRPLETIDQSFTGGHWEVEIKDLRLPKSAILGQAGEGFRNVQTRLAPARLTHCMRWLGAAKRAHMIASEYAAKRQAFGKTLGQHEGVSFMLADNEIELQQARLMIWWAASLLDHGEKARHESSMVKTAVSESLFRIADRCVQILGGMGVSDDTVVSQIFREIRAFRIYDGPSEVHRWAIGNRVLKSANETSNDT
ncbi:MAG: acyl-CoA dehydrogenase family protein [Alphaproteobacteria bacterium]|nr:acyl-CoA dehydrogenase family protein [Alphaproteobacteria bacterium]